MDYEQQKAAHHRNVLPEHDHLCLIGEVVVEGEGRQYREAGQQHGDEG